MSVFTSCVDIESTLSIFLPDTALDNDHLVGALSSPVSRAAVRQCSEAISRVDHSVARHKVDLAMIAAVEGEKLAAAGDRRDETALFG